MRVRKYYRLYIVAVFGKYGGHNYTKAQCASFYSILVIAYFISFSRSSLLPLFTLFVVRRRCFRLLISVRVTCLLLLVDAFLTCILLTDYNYFAEYRKIREEHLIQIKWIEYKKSEILTWDLLIPGTDGALVVFILLDFLLRISKQVFLLLLIFLLFRIVLWESSKRASSVLLWDFKDETIFFLYFLFAFREVCRNDKIHLP